MLFINMLYDFHDITRSFVFNITFKRIKAKEKRSRQGNDILWNTRSINKDGNKLNLNFFGVYLF